MLREGFAAHSMVAGSGQADLTRPCNFIEDRKDNAVRRTVDVVLGSVVQRAGTGHVDRAIRLSEVPNAIGHTLTGARERQMAQGRLAVTVASTR